MQHAWPEAATHDATQCPAGGRNARCKQKKHAAIRTTSKPRSHPVQGHNSQTTQQRQQTKKEATPCKATVHRQGQKGHKPPAPRKATIRRQGQQGNKQRCHPMQSQFTDKTKTATDLPPVHAQPMFRPNRFLTRTISYMKHIFQSMGGRNASCNAIPPKTLDQQKADLHIRGHAAKGEHARAAAAQNLRADRNTRLDEAGPWPPGQSYAFGSELRHRHWSLWERATQLDCTNRGMLKMQRHRHTQMATQHEHTDGAPHQT